MSLEPPRLSLDGNGRKRKRGPTVVALAVLVLALVSGIVALGEGLGRSSSHRGDGTATTTRGAGTGRAANASTTDSASGYGRTPVSATLQATVKRDLAHSVIDTKPLKAGLLFDVRSGRVLWSRNAEKVLPIASLTKLMTALLVVEHSPVAGRVLVTKQALDYTGSGVGELPLGKRVPERALLYGLLLPSGNDAAIALSQHVASTQTKFIAMMNAKARSLDLTCTHYTTVSGVIDQGNHSCAVDLARLADLVLMNRTLAGIVATTQIRLKFPIKGGHLYLYNNNPLLEAGYPGTVGVKTGYTEAAGMCLIAAVKRGDRWLGIVLLHSANWLTQAEALLNAGFEATA